MKRIILLLAAVAGLCLSASAAPKQKADQNTVISISFHDGAKLVWPFEGKSTQVPTSARDENPLLGKETAFTVRGSSHVFKFCPSTTLVRNSKRGIRFGSKVGDYIEFPAIPGQAVTKVVLVSGATNGNCGNPKITDASGADVEGGAAWTGNKQTGEEHSWVLSGLKAGEPARLVLSSKYTCDIFGITVYYQVPGKVKKVKKAKVK